jgi:signal transduction histidine kinase
VAIVRVDDRGLVTFIGGDAALREALLGGAKTGADIASLDFGLADATGRFVFGRVPSSSDRVVSTANETGLPWTIYAAHTASAADTNGASTRRRAMLGGAALVGACVLLGGWFTARAMHRELEVARVQSDFVAAVSHEFRTPLAAVATAGSRAATSAGVSWGDGPQTASGYWRGCSGRLAVTIWFWSPSTAAGRA